MNVSLDGSQASAPSPGSGSQASVPSRSDGSTNQDDGVGKQPRGDIVYAAAAEPMLEAGSKDSPSLLRPDQMEMLARSLIGRAMFPVDEHAGDIKQAETILKQVTVRGASYARATQASALLNSLH